MPPVPVLDDLVGPFPVLSIMINHFGVCSMAILGYTRVHVLKVDSLVVLISVGALVLAISHLN